MTKNGAYIECKLKAIFFKNTTKTRSDTQNICSSVANLIAKRTITKQLHFCSIKYCSYWIPFNWTKRPCSKWTRKLRNAPIITLGIEVNNLKKWLPQFSKLKTTFSALKSKTTDQKQFSKSLEKPLHERYCFEGCMRHRWDQLKAQREKNLSYTNTARLAKKTQVNVLVINQNIHSSTDSQGIPEVWF